MLHQADGSPCFLWGRGPLTSSRGRRSAGARGCRNCRQHAGLCEVQLWGFLSPLGFTHPLSIKHAFPPSHFSFFVCVCVLIVPWLLACFHNPILTFLTATEKLGIPPTGKQSERPERIPALCTNPRGEGRCPTTKEEDVRITCGMRAQGSQKPRGPLLPPTHFTDEGHESQRVTVTCTRSLSFKQSKMTQFVKTVTMKHFSVQVNI